MTNQDNINDNLEVHTQEPGESASQLFNGPGGGRNHSLFVPTLASGIPTGSVRATKQDLPVPVTPLVGREQVVLTACTILRRAEVRLLTLTGIGGVGKTRVGLQVATDLRDDFADGVYFVSLASLSNPDLVIPSIAQALDFTETGDQPQLDLMKVALRDKCLLLLLDNFEQVVAAASGLSDLLAVCPHMKILVTSRTVLHIQGEHELPVRPLELPNLAPLPESKPFQQYAAVALFLQRARAAKPDFQMTPENAPAIVEICTSLEGLPLALELAAPHVKLFSPKELLDHLVRQWPQLLVSSAPDILE